MKSAFVSTKLNSLRDGIDRDATLSVIFEESEADAREFTTSGPNHFVRSGLDWHSWNVIRHMSQCVHLVFAKYQRDKSAVVPAVWTRDSLRPPSA